MNREQWPHEQGEMAWTNIPDMEHLGILSNIFVVEYEN